MYLPNRPVYYTDGKQTVAVHYSAHAFDLEEEGWTIVDSKESVSPTPAPEQEESLPFEDDGEPELDLNDMTKAELVAYAEAIGVEIVGYKNKAEIIALIEEAGNG